MYQILRGGFKTIHPSSFVRSCPVGVSNYLLLIIHTAGNFQIGSKYWQLTPGHGLIIAPGTPYHYSNPNGAYIDDWLHFQPSDTQKFSQIFPITDEPFPLENPEIFTTFIHQILWEHAYSEIPYAEENIDALFTLLLNHLLADYQNKNLEPSISSYKSQLQTLRLEIKNTLFQPHSIKNHAHNIGVSESYFQHLYSEYFGIPFQKDLIRLRIDQAQYLLSTTTSTIEEIAQRCGYTNSIHFYRQFKSCTGMTPKQYRTTGPNLPE